MAEDHAGPAGQDNDGEAKPGDEYRFAAGPGHADAAVVDGQIVDEPGEVLGTIVSDDGSPTFEEIRFRLSRHECGEPRGVRRGRGPRPRRDPGLLGAVPGAGRARGQPPRGSAERDRARRAAFEALYAREGESTIIYRLVRCEPVEELPAADGGIGDPAEIRTLPRAGDLGAPTAPGHDHRRDGLPARS